MNSENLRGIAPLVDETRGIVSVIIETPGGSQNKYDYDESSGLFALDRPIHSSLRYPFDYGFLPNTIAGDGDPIDVVLMIGEPTFSGCLIRARIVGVMIMKDEGGGDEKILAVSATDPRMLHINDVQDVPPHWLKELEHFFIHIKDLEKEKWAEVEGFEARERAIAIVKQGVLSAARE